MLLHKYISVVRVKDMAADRHTGGVIFTNWCILREITGAERNASQASLKDAWQPCIIAYVWF